MGRLKDSSLHARALASARLVISAAPAYLVRRARAEPIPTTLPRTNALSSSIRPAWSATNGAWNGAARPSPSRSARACAAAIHACLLARRARRRRAHPPGRGGCAARPRCGPAWCVSCRTGPGPSGRCTSSIPRGRLQTLRLRALVGLRGGGVGVTFDTHECICNYVRYNEGHCMTARPRPFRSQGHPDRQLSGCRASPRGSWPT